MFLSNHLGSKHMCRLLRDQFLHNWRHYSSLHLCLGEPSFRQINIKPTTRRDTSDVIHWPGFVTMSGCIIHHVPIITSYTTGEPKVCCIDIWSTRMDWLGFSTSSTVPRCSTCFCYPQDRFIFNISYTSLYIKNKTLTLVAQRRTTRGR